MPKKNTKEAIIQLVKDYRYVETMNDSRNSLKQIRTALTTIEEEVRRSERERIMQKLREIDLIDYYCKCNDQGHIIAMTRTAYDELLQTLTNN